MGKENPTSYEAYKMARLVKNQVENDFNDSIKKNHIAPSTRSTVIDSNAVKMDSTYWNKIRPIPLAANEVKSIVTYDSLRVINQKKDSLEQTPRGKKIKVIRTLLIGGNFISDTTKNWRFDGLIGTGFKGFNTVDGWNYSVGTSIYRRLKNYSSIKVNGLIGYAIDREQLLWNIQGSYSFRQDRNIIQIGTGRVTLDFNGEGATAIENRFSSLFFRQNLNRFYEKQSYWGQYSMYLATGLKMTTSISISNNLPLTNHSNFSILYRNERDYQLNIPENADYAMTSHRNSVVGLGLEYTPGQNYYLLKNQRVYTPSRYPTLSVYWKKGVPAFLDGETKYQFIKAMIHQEIKFNMSERLIYTFSSGLFLDNKPTDFSEFNHFATQPLSVGVKDFYDTFQLLDYYQYSTNDRFIEGHVSYTTPYLILKRLPIIRDRAWTEKVIASYLYTPLLQNYTEIGYGIGNELYNIGIFGSFRNLNSDRIGLKVSLKIFTLRVESR